MNVCEKIGGFGIKTFLNYVYIILVILWQPLQQRFLHIDGQGRILFVLTIFVFCYNIFNKKYYNIVASKPAMIWLIWICYAFVNMMIQGHDFRVGAPTYFVGQLFKPFVFMTIVAFECMQDYKNLIKVLWISFLIYCCIGFFFMDLVREEGMDMENVQIKSLNTLGNSLPLNCVWLTVFALLVRLQDNSVKHIYIYASIFFSIYVIMIMATRKAFGAVIIILLFSFLPKIKFTAKNILLLILGGIICYFIYDYIMTSTFIGERFSEGVEVGERKNTTDIKWLSFLGDRATFYINGWSIFLENPFCGIGLENYQEVAHSHYRLHTEYIVQLAENGIIGFILYICFYVNIVLMVIKNIKMSVGNARIVNFVLGGCVVAILFVALTAWTYSFTNMYACLGCIIACKECNFMENTNTEKSTTD